MKSSKKALLSLLLACGSLPVMAADRSVGVLFSESGPGLSYSSKAPFSLRQDDQLQLRFQLSGVSSGEVDDIEVNKNDFTGKAKLADHKITADWFPFAQNQFFVSAGVGYLQNDLDLKSKAGSGYTVGKTHVANDGSTLSADISQGAVAPYIGVGWGGKLDAHEGLGFFAELGLMKPLKSADVRVSSTSSSVSSADIAAEQKKLEDIFSDFRLAATVGLSYRF